MDDDGARCSAGGGVSRLRDVADDDDDEEDVVPIAVVPWVNGVWHALIMPARVLRSASRSSTASIGAGTPDFTESIRDAYAAS